MLRAVYGTVIPNKAPMWSACTENQQNPEMPVPWWWKDEWKANS